MEVIVKKNSIVLLMSVFMIFDLCAGFVRQSLLKLPQLTQLTRSVRSISLLSSKEEILKHYNSKNIVSHKSEQERREFLLHQLAECKNDVQVEKMKKILLGHNPTIKEHQLFTNLIKLHNINKNIKHEQINSLKEMLEFKKQLEKEEGKSHKIMAFSFACLLGTIPIFGDISHTLVHVGMGLSFLGIGFSAYKNNCVSREIKIIEKEMKQ